MEIKRIQAFLERRPLRNRDPLCPQHDLGQSFVHGKRRAGVARSGIPDLPQVKCGLDSSILTVRTVKREEDKVAHAAEFQDVRAEKAPGGVRFCALDLAVKRPDIRCRLIDIVIIRKSIHQVGIFAAEKGVDEDRQMSVLPERLADTRTGNN